MCFPTLRLVFRLLHPRPKGRGFRKKKVSEAVQARAMVKEEFGEKPIWWVRQGSPSPTCAITSPIGIVTCWFEVQPTEMVHLLGMFTKESSHPTGYCSS